MANSQQIANKSGIETENRMRAFYATGHRAARLEFILERYSEQYTIIYSERISIDL